MTSILPADYQAFFSHLSNKYAHNNSKIGITISYDADQGVHELVFENTKMKLSEFCNSVFIDFLQKDDVQEKAFLTRVVQVVHESVFAFRESRKVGVSWLLSDMKDKVVAKCGGQQRESLKDKVVIPFLGKAYLAVNNPAVSALFALDRLNGDEEIVQETMRIGFQNYLKDFNKIFKDEIRSIGKSVVENFGNEIFEEETRRGFIEEVCRVLKKASDPREMTNVLLCDEETAVAWNNLFIEWKKSHLDGDCYDFLTDVEVQEKIGSKLFCCCLHKKSQDFSFSTVQDLEDFMKREIISVRGSENGEVRGPFLVHLFGVWKTHHPEGNFYHFLTEPLDVHIHREVLKKSEPRFASLFNFSLNFAKEAALTFSAPDDKELVFSQKDLEAKKTKMARASINVINKLIIRAHSEPGIIGNLTVGLPEALRLVSVDRPSPVVGFANFFDNEPEYTPLLMNSNYQERQFVDNCLRDDVLNDFCWTFGFDKQKNEHVLVDAIIGNVYLTKLFDCLSKMVEDSVAIDDLSNNLRQIELEIEKWACLQTVLEKIAGKIEQYREARRGTLENLGAGVNRQSIKGVVIPALDRARTSIVSRLAQLRAMKISDL